MRPACSPLLKGPRMTEPVRDYGAAPGLDDIQDWWDGFNASHPDFLL